MIRLTAVLPLLLFLAACSGTREQTWSRDLVDAQPAWKEATVALPAYPSAANLVEFDAGLAARHRFFVDASTLSVGGDGVVRFVVVVQAEGGARTATFEGIRCATREKRLYAVGAAGSSWREARASTWERIRFGVRNEYQESLYREHFCPDHLLVVSAAVAVRSLRAAQGAVRR